VDEAQTIRSILSSDPAVGEIACVLGLTVEALIDAVAAGEAPVFQVEQGYSEAADCGAVEAAIESAEHRAGWAGFGGAPAPQRAPHEKELKGRIEIDSAAANRGMAEQIRAGMVLERSRHQAPPAKRGAAGAVPRTSRP
jgi:hypothetical protein